MGISNIIKRQASNFQACKTFSLEMVFPTLDRDNRKADEVPAVNLTMTKTFRPNSVGTPSGDGTEEKGTKRTRDNLSDKVKKLIGETSHVEAKEMLKKVLGKRQERTIEVDCCAEHSRDCTVIVGWKGWCAFEGEEDEETVEPLINKRDQRRMLERATKLLKMQGNQNSIEVESKVGIGKELKSEHCTNNSSSTSNVGPLELLGKSLNEAAHTKELTTFTRECFQPGKSPQINDDVLSPGTLVPYLSNSAAFKDCNKMEGGIFEGTEELNRQGFELIAQSPDSAIDRGEGAIFGSSINEEMGTMHTDKEVHEGSQASVFEGVGTVNDKTYVIQINDTDEDGGVGNPEQLEQKTAASILSDGSAVDCLQGPLSNQSGAWNSSKKGPVEGALRLNLSKKKRSEMCRGASVEAGKVRMTGTIADCVRRSKRVRESSQRRRDSIEAAEGPAVGPSVLCPICLKILPGDIESRDFNTELNWHIDKCVKLQLN